MMAIKIESKKNLANWLLCFTFGKTLNGVFVAVWHSKAVQS